MTPCIVFPGCKDTGGYGLKRVKNKLYKAHRLTWILTKGAIPEGLFVCHTCDNPGCININHLFLGNNSDNMLDMYSKGRGRPSELCASKLTWDKIDEIRLLLLQGLTQQKIATIYNVDRTLISQIKRKKIWIKPFDKQ